MGTTEAEMYYLRNLGSGQLVFVTGDAGRERPAQFIELHAAEEACRILRANGHNCVPVQQTPAAA